ncbi:MAG: hypothetical protein ACE1ZI_01335, partial [Acidobacteriota bacterium]
MIIVTNPRRRCTRQPVKVLPSINTVMFIAALRPQIQGAPTSRYGTSPPSRSSTSPHKPPPQNITVFMEGSTKQD